MLDFSERNLAEVHPNPLIIKDLGRRGGRAGAVSYWLSVTYDHGSFSIKSAGAIILVSSKLIFGEAKFSHNGFIRFVFVKH